MLISIKDSVVGRHHTSSAGPSDTSPETAGLPLEAQLPYDAFSDVTLAELAPSVYFRDLVTDPPTHDA